jgi:hypothetical protein
MQFKLGEKAGGGIRDSIEKNEEVGIFRLTSKAL